MNFSELPNGWWAIARSQEINDKPLGLERFGTHLVLWRTLSGELICLSDLCPHRSVKLSLGKIKGNCIQCPFHGFEFDQNGDCALIPQTGRAGQGIKASKFLTQEKHGFVWLYNGDTKNAHLCEIPWFSEVTENLATSGFRQNIACHFTRAIENQLDYAHLTFVHAKTIGRFSKPDISMHITEESDRISFTSDNNKENPQTKIDFKFPNIWLNKISEKMVITLAFVPINENKTLLYLDTHQSFIKIRWMKPLIDWLFNKMNQRILAEDIAMTDSHPGGSSLLTGTDEKLVGIDHPIKIFRKIYLTKLPVNQKP